VNLRNTTMNNSELGGANLKNADLTGAEFIAKAKGANLEGAIMVRLKGGANMDNQSMGMLRTILDYANLENANLEEDKRAGWAQKILNIQKLEAQEQNPDFIEELKLDILHDRIFVFTPKGDSIDLPKDATCIDFAYEIHSEVGHRALKAEVNGEIVPLTTRLNNGDTVNIVTSDVPKGPSRAWLEFVKTNTARNNILNYFRKTSEEEKLSTGRSLLQKELDRAGLGLVDNISQKKIRAYCSVNLQCKSFDDILIAIGEGTLRPVDFVSSVFDATVKIKRMSSIVPVSDKTESEKKQIKVTLRIVSDDAVGQLKKILNVLSEMRVNASRTLAYLTFWKGDFICKTTVVVENFSEVSTICEHMEQIVGVRRQPRAR